MFNAQANKTSSGMEKETNRLSAHSPAVETPQKVWARFPLQRKGTTTLIARFPPLRTGAKNLWQGFLYGGQFNIK
jgi:hypothetical protein